MPSAEGRIDHMAVDTVSGRVFAAVYGGNTLDVVNVHRVREVAVLHTGLNEQQGVAFVPALGRIVVSNSRDGHAQ